LNGHCNEPQRAPPSTPLPMREGRTLHPPLTGYKDGGFNPILAQVWR
jgi:hypothetical protein